jgi:hypothetical protein
VQLHGVASVPANLEATLDDVAPAEHHLPLVIRQLRTPLRDKSLDDDTPVGESVLQREVVNGEHGRALVQVAVAIGGVAQQPGQPTGEARALGERHQLALQFRSAGDQIV